MGFFGNINVASSIIAFISLIIVIWQTIKNIKLKKYIKTEAMELYLDTGILLGNAQSCLRNLQENNTNLIIEEAGKTEGMAQAIFLRSIKNIHHHFDFTRKELEDWIKNKKIYDFHKDYFLKYAEK